MTGGDLRKTPLFVCFLLGMAPWVTAIQPAAADTAMDMQVIRCGPSTMSNSCGSNPAASEPLNQGYVRVSTTGDVAVGLKGASPNKTYYIWVANWIKDGRSQLQYKGNTSNCNRTDAIGTITTNAAGDFEGRITTASGGTFAFPAGTLLGQPNFAFNTKECRSHFTTGFAIN